MATSSASLDRSPRSNWVEETSKKTGKGLPPGVRKVARKLKQLHPGWSLSRCIATAISRSKVWAAGGSAKGARNVAGWEALKGANKARMGSKSVSAANPALEGMVLHLSNSYGADTAPPMSLAQAGDELAEWLELATPAETAEWLDLAADKVTAESLRLARIRAKELGKEEKGKGKKKFNEAAHPRAGAGSPTGGEFVPAGTARNSEAAEAQKDKEAAGNSEKVQKGALTPDKLSDEQLQKLSRYLYSWKSSDPKVVAARVKAAGELRKRGMDPAKFGSLAGQGKPATKPRPTVKPIRKPAAASKPKPKPKPAKTGTVAAAEPADDVAWLDLATERRVRTPAGVKRYGKPIGAIITAGSAPKVRRGADYVRSARKAQATRNAKASEAATKLTRLTPSKLQGVVGKASAQQLAAVDAEFTRRAAALGQPDRVSPTHKAVKDARAALRKPAAEKPTQPPPRPGSGPAATADRFDTMSRSDRKAAAKSMSVGMLAAVHNELKDRQDQEPLDHRKAALSAQRTVVANELKVRGMKPGDDIRRIAEQGSLPQGSRAQQEMADARARAAAVRAEGPRNAPKTADDRLARLTPEQREAVLAVRAKKAQREQGGEQAVRNAAQDARVQAATREQVQTDVAETRKRADDANRDRIRQKMAAARLQSAKQRQAEQRSYQSPADRVAAMSDGAVLGRAREERRRETAGEPPVSADTRAAVYARADMLERGGRAPTPDRELQLIADAMRKQEAAGPPAPRTRGEHPAMADIRADIAAKTQRNRQAVAAENTEDARRDRELATDRGRTDAELNAMSAPDLERLQNRLLTTASVLPNADWEKRRQMQDLADRVGAARSRKQQGASVTNLADRRASTSPAAEQPQREQFGTSGEYREAMAGWRQRTGVEDPSVARARNQGGTAALRGETGTVAGMRPQPDMSNPERLSDAQLTERMDAARTRLRAAKEGDPRRTGQGYADAKLSHDVFAAEMRRRSNAAAFARTGNPLPGERVPGAPTPTPAGRPFPTGPRAADSIAPGMQVDVGTGAPVTVASVERGSQRGTVDLVDTGGRRHTFGTSERARVVGGTRPQRAQDVSGTPENIAARQQARARGASQPSMFAGEEERRLSDAAVRQRAAGTLFGDEDDINDEAAAVAEMSPRRTASTRAAQAELARAQAPRPAGFDLSGRTTAELRTEQASLKADLRRFARTNRGMLAPTRARLAAIEAAIAGRS